MAWVLGPVKSKAIRFGPVNQRRTGLLVRWLVLEGRGTELLAVARIGVGGGMHTFPDGSLQERQCWAHGYRRVMACVFGGAAMWCGLSLGTRLRRFLTKDLGWTCELDSDSDWMIVGDHADSV